MNPGQILGRTSPVGEWFSKALVLICFILVHSLQSSGAGLRFMPYEYGLSNLTKADDPELVLQAGHKEVIESLVFSSDGTLLVSGSTDRLIRLWETTSGRLINALRLDAPGEQGLAVSPRDSIVAIRSGKEVLLWNWKANRITATLRGEVGWGLAFSPTGQWLVTGNKDGSLQIWEVSSQHLIRTLRMPPGVNAVAVSHDGKLLAAGSNNGSVRLWAFASGNLIADLPSHKWPIVSISFSVNDEAVISFDIDEMKSWDIKNQRSYRSLRLNLKANNVWQVSSDNQVAAFASRAIVSLDHSVGLVDVATGRQIKVLEGHKLPVTALAFSPDSRVLATGSWDLSLKLWDWQNGRPLKSLEGNYAGITTVSISRDGKKLVTGGKERFLRLWNLQSGELEKSSFTHSNWVFSAALSPDNKVVASVDSHVRLWEIDKKASGDELPNSYIEPPGPSQIVSFSRLSNHLAYGASDQRVRVWDVANKRVVREFAAPSEIKGLSFANDDNLIAINREDSITLWNWYEDRIIKTWNVRPGRTIAFSPDGSNLAIGGDWNVEIWELASYKLVDTLKVSSPVNALGFSAKHNVLAIGCKNGQIRIWDASAKRIIDRYFEHEHSITSISFLKGGEVLVSGSDDTTIKLWSVERMQLLATIEPLASEDWIVFTPDGFFDGTERAWNLAPFRFPSEPLKLYEPEQFFNQFFQPGLLADIAREGRPIREILRDEKDPRANMDISRLRQSTLPQVKIIKPKAADTVSSRTITVEIETTNTGAGVQDCRVFRNQSLVHYEPSPVGSTPSANSKYFSTEVQLVAGQNEISAYCFNRDGLKSKDDSVLLTSEALKRRGTAYIIAVGINTYANKHYNLKYAAKDALDFGERLRQAQINLDTFEHVEVIPLLNEAATRVNILTAFERLAPTTSDLPQTFPEILRKIHPAQPEDTVIIFFSGHGTAQQGHFYLVPHDLGIEGERANLDEAGLRSMLLHSISDIEIEKTLRAVDAGIILLVIDACNSGQALEAAEKRRGPMNSRGLAQLAYEKGMYVLAAAQSYQAAWEISELNHGLLTYVLIDEGLKEGGAAVSTGDKEITLKTWLDYAVERVPQMQMSKMLQCKDPIRLCPAVVEGEERIKQIERRSVQRPRVFYRRGKLGSTVTILKN